jgi:Gram-negative bacterial TonB protein C-terminal
LFAANIGPSSLYRWINQDYLPFSEPVHWRQTARRETERLETHPRAAFEKVKMELFSRTLTLMLLLACLEWANAQSVAPHDELMPPAAPFMLLTSGPSTSGADMPVPEGGMLGDSTYSNRYFGFSYHLPHNWEQTFAGPPPSDTGYYVLAQFRPQDTSPQAKRGTILISAADQFFATQQADNPKDLIEHMKAKLNPVYQVEASPLEVKLGNHIFVRLDYKAPAADLHWRILATEIRCHIVEFVLTGRDTELLESLIQSVGRMQWLATSGIGQSDAPLCIPDYATGPNLVRKVDPAFAGPRFTDIPVRIVIDNNGKVKHVHVISASPAQAENIEAALARWEFKPYVQDGRPLEVETGILFEFPPRSPGRPRQFAGRPQ